MKATFFLSATLAILAFADARNLQSVTAESKPEWLAIPDMQNHLHFVNTRQIVPRTIVADSEVTFYYYSRATNYVTLRMDNADDIFKTDFTPKRKTMFIIHGWTSNGKSDMNHMVTSALLKVDDWNVFNIDWSGPASKNYISSKGAVPGVGDVIAKFIQFLVDNAGLDLDQVYITGHSLGGQISGRVGANLKGQAGYIMGLDPALPLFSYDNIDGRLDPSDAKHVQVIHTNGGVLGYYLPLGHSDFYPNGGKKQHGCGTDFFGMCSHLRAYEYFTESIESGLFISHSCEDYDKYRDGHCHGNHYSRMGGNSLDKSASGSYFLETSDVPPYALDI